MPSAVPVSYEALQLAVGPDLRQAEHRAPKQRLGHWMQYLTDRRPPDIHRSPAELHRDCGHAV
jgi:hypothetical protein